MEKPKALVLLSGGIDSTTCLAMAMERYGERNVSALNMFYGQKHQREISAARQVASHYGILYMEMDLSCVMQYSDCPLLAHSDREIRHESYANQLKALGGEGTVDTYVPFRNGRFLLLHRLRYFMFTIIIRIWALFFNQPLHKIV